MSDRKLDRESEIKEERMERWIFLLVCLCTQQVFGNFIVKYRSGRMQKTKIDPRQLNAISISTEGNEIEYVEEDRVLHRHGYSNDPLYSQQWAMVNYLNDTFSRAKSEVSSGAQVTVAVVDTGMTNHSELNSIVVGGYDFISDTTNARDGGGRDSDATDPGDYGDYSVACSGNSSSSWHGTHIAGIIAARSNNGVGVAGAGTNIRILPLRVLGPCGGQTSDIADAVRWAAGGSVSGTPSNSYPAKVINLSLGGKGQCSRYMQEAVDYANSRGSVVVVSAGNDGSSIDSMDYTPANCRGVFRVGAVNTSVGESNYTNYGKIVDISAPGDIIYSTVNSGYNSPSGESYKSMSGTSMSAGFISAAAAMVFSENPNLYSDQVKDILARTSQSFLCQNANCSRGTVDAFEAVIEARSEIADASFRYDDPVVVGGFSSVSTTVQTTKGGGGACGTIEDRSRSQKNYFGSFLILCFAFILSTKLSMKRS